MLFTADEEGSLFPKAMILWRCWLSKLTGAIALLEVTNYHLLDAQGGPILCANVLDDIAHWPDRKSPLYKLKSAGARRRLQRLHAAKPDFVMPAM